MPFKIDFDLLLLLLGTVIGITRDLLQSEPVGRVVGFFDLGIGLACGALFRLVREIQAPQFGGVKRETTSLGSRRCPSYGKRAGGSVRFGRFPGVRWQRGSCGAQAAITIAAASMHGEREQQQHGARGTM